MLQILTRHWSIMTLWGKGKKLFPLATSAFNFYSVVLSPAGVLCGPAIFLQKQRPTCSFKSAHLKHSAMFCLHAVFMGTILPPRELI